jgi:hypothetical protein
MSLFHRVYCSSFRGLAQSGKDYGHLSSLQHLSGHLYRVARGAVSTILMLSRPPYMAGVNLDLGPSAE